MTAADPYIPLDKARRDHAADRLRRGLDIINPTTWEGQPIPERRWIVPGLIPCGSVTLLTGDGGTGKSLLALQLMTACGLGQPFLGIEVEPIRTLGIYCEDERDELQRRLVPILAHYDSTFADLDALELVSRVAGGDNSLMTFEQPGKPGEVTPLHAEIMNRAINTGARLLVLDSLHDLFPGNENIRQHARQFIGSLREIALEIDGAVLVLGHPSAAGLASGSGTAGSTGWSNSVRARCYLTRPEPEDGEPVDRDARTLDLPKSNYGPAGGQIRLRYRDGVFIRDEAGGGFVDHLAKGNQESADDAVFLHCLDVLTAQNRNVSHSTNAKNYAPKEMVGMKEAGKIGRRRLESAMKRLFSAGEILANLPVGSRANRHQQFGIQRAPK